MDPEVNCWHCSSNPRFSTLYSIVSTSRLYFDLKPGSPLMKELCAKACSNPNIDLCYVRKIPGAGDIHKIFPMNWRFLPVLDPQVKDIGGTSYIFRAF